jgi:hypothetical protein
MRSAARAAALLSDRNFLIGIGAFLRPIEQALQLAIFFLVAALCARALRNGAGGQRNQRDENHRSQ